MEGSDNPSKVRKPLFMADTDNLSRLITNPTR